MAKNKSFLNKNRNKKPTANITKNYFNKSLFVMGLKNSVPVGLGYLSVSFAFGIFAVSKGMKPIEALLISMFNLTSAGQLAAVPIIASGGKFIELALTEFIINIRYSLMSILLAEKADKNFTAKKRAALSFGITDEIFALGYLRNGSLKYEYFFGLLPIPYFCWSIGSILGAVAGNILPQIIISALGIMIYAMFTAIVLPEAKKQKAVAFCSLLSIALSLAFYYIKFLKAVPAGFALIICAVAASVISALIFPKKDEEETETAKETAEEITKELKEEVKKAEKITKQKKIKKQKEKTT